MAEVQGDWQSKQKCPDHEEQLHTVSDAYEQEPVEMDFSGLLPKYPERSSRSRAASVSEALAGAGLDKTSPRSSENCLKRILLWVDFPADGLGGMGFSCLSKA